MIRIDRPTDCCGCEACAQRCPKQCIAMRADAEGFLYPHIDTAVCIDCGLCERVCPMLRQEQPRKPIAVYAAKNPDERIRMESSSGGVFTLLAEQTIRAGGVVFGARFDEAWEVVHDSTETIEGLAAFRGSKYVQSRIGTSFARAEEFLKQGRQVLFSGTPCQIAGLNRFLRRSYDNLLTVDVVCHGVPSPLVWRRYLDGIGGGTTVSHVSMRDKSTGWTHFRIRISDTDRDLVNATVGDDPFMKGFLANLYLRPVCHACPAKSGRSGSDLTIADFWGIRRVLPHFADDKGISLLLNYSEHGNHRIEALHMERRAASYEQALIGNPSIERSVPEPKQRKTFWDSFGSENTDLRRMVADITRHMGPSRSSRILSALKSRMKRLLQNRS